MCYKKNVWSYNVKKNCEYIRIIYSRKIEKYKKIAKTKKKKKKSPNNQKTTRKIMRNIIIIQLNFARHELDFYKYERRVKKKTIGKKKIRIPRTIIIRSVWRRFRIIMIIISFAAQMMSTNTTDRWFSI